VIKDPLRLIYIAFGYGLLLFTQKEKKKKLKGCTQLEGDIVDLWLFYTYPDRKTLTSFRSLDAGFRSLTFSRQPNMDSCCAV